MPPPASVRPRGACERLLEKELMSEVMCVMWYEKRVGAVRALADEARLPLSPHRGERGRSLLCAAAGANQPARPCWSVQTHHLPSSPL